MATALCRSRTCGSRQPYLEPPPRYLNLARITYDVARVRIRDRSAGHDRARAGDCRAGLRRLGGDDFACASWRGLIDAGVERCRTLGVPDDWCQFVRGQLQLASHPDMLLSAAELVHQKLREQGGELARWLRDTFAELQPEDPTVIQLLVKLDVPLVTTNYDDLIEKTTQLKHVCWTDAASVSRFVRGDERRVLHLHGHWQEPDSVVLGIRSYEAVKNNEHTQAVMRALGIAKSFLFVGCGDEGLADPNFGKFLTWLAAIDAAAKVEHRHYRLVRKQDAREPQGRLFPLVYGETYDDLPRFLERLIPEPPARHGEGQPQKPVLRVPPPLPANIAHYLTCLAGRNGDPDAARHGSESAGRVADRRSLRAVADDAGQIDGRTPHRAIPGWTRRIRRKRRPG